MISTPPLKATPEDDDMANAFVEAFNTSTFSPGQMQQLTDTGMDTTVSSPEQITNADHTPTSGTGGTEGVKLNPRSCVTCRRRKVRCDKREPCSNCVKAHNECVFPPPGRAPRKPRRPHDAELLKRLRRLESVVDSLGTQVDDDGNVHPSVEANESNRRSVSEVFDLSPQAPRRKTSLEHRLGHLLIKDGRSRYVSNEFWSSLGEEIAEIRCVLDSPSSEEDDDADTPDSATDASRAQSLHQGWIFGYSSVMYDMSRLHPSPSQIFIIWEIFKENVDPVLKIVHAPTVKNVIMKAAVRASSLSKASEALFYAICFSAVVSMSEDQCMQLLSDEKSRLMQRYRFAVEQGLARAQFLNSSNLVVLQAFIMFLACVKYIDTSRSTWALSGLAMQQAQSQGLHRDGTNFNLLPFEVEMRRRLWWHITLLDARASEDHGADPTFQDHFFDTKLPLNVNDEDIWPEMTEEPREQPGASDMTFTLLRFELGHMQRKLRISTCAETDEDMKNSIREKERMIDLTHQRMQEKYFVHCDPTSPILWVSSTVGKLILAKMWLFVHHPRVTQDTDSQAIQELRDQVFMTSIEVIEFGVLLGRSKNTAKWAWLFRTYMQWHAVAHVLSELCTRPEGLEYNRAWNAVDSVYDRRITDQAKNQRGVLWRPLKQLYARAKKRRQGLTLRSPESIDSNQSVKSESPAQSLMNGTTQNNSNFNLGINPFNQIVATQGDAFGIDFNESVFDDMGGGYGNDLNNVNQSNQNQQQNQAGFQPFDTIPFNWQPGMVDFLDEYAGYPTQQDFRQSVPQEWH